jgi:hypothetical protein
MMFYEEERLSYILGGHCKTEVPMYAVELLRTEYVEVPEAGETYVYETWLCGTEDDSE